MYNIQKAVSRLDFAPKLKEIEITDITKGTGAFTPRPDKPVSFALLHAALKKAGYTLDSAEITVVGQLKREGENWWLVAELSGQRFALESADVDRRVSDFTPGVTVAVRGNWQTVGTKAAAREVIKPRDVWSTDAPVKRAALVGTVAARVRPADEMRAVEFAPARFEWPRPDIDGVVLAPSAAAVAPIRTTSPGLTVYKGGAFIPRFAFVRQHLGPLVVKRQLLDLSFTYTPTSTLQLEAQVPFARTSFADGVTTGVGSGLGNVALWGKYRFYRRVKTYGDRQAAVRFGLELPTGKKAAPTRQRLNAPDFVRAQLTPISGGLAPAAALAYAQAVRRFIFGGDLSGVLRTERAGFRTGHELRLNTDTEFVVYPFKYRRPVGELFALLETTLIRRGVGRSAGRAVPGSSATEYYLAPGLQYVATPQLVVEGSAQLPVVRRTGAQVLRTEHNILFALHYLF